jgi:hypothetical protein
MAAHSHARRVQAIPELRPKERLLLQASVHRLYALRAELLLLVPTQQVRPAAEMQRIQQPCSST